MRHSILVIDDNDIDRVIAEHILLRSEQTGEIIKQPSANDALNYLDALERNNKHFPDIILLDINMPELNGFEFVQLFSTYHPDAIAKTCVYLLTSSNNKEDKRRAEKEGCIKGYFVKPLTQEIVEKIYNHPLAQCA